MIIYNVTTKVLHSVKDQWLKWLKEEHIPEILATKCFQNATVLYLMEADDDEGVTYAVQYHAESLASYNEYIDKFSNEMRAKTIDKWKEKTISFRTIMQIVN